MSVYKRKLRSGRRSKLYTAEFTYRGAVHRKGGFVDRDHARDWLSAEMNRLRRRSTGYVKPMLKSAVLPLVERFAAALRADGRDEMYVYTSDKRLRRLASECGWVTLEHVTAASLDNWKVLDTRQDKRRKLAGARTKNQYLATAKQWGEWLAKKAGVLAANPLADVTTLPAKHNDEYRRAGTLEELNKVLAIAGERRAFYIFRIYQSSVRGDTLARLTWRMAHLDANPPFLAVPGEIDKGRKDIKYVLRFDVAQELRAERKRTKGKADDLIFPNPVTLDQFKADLSSAGIPFEHAKDKGRLDYHALRGTLVEMGKNAGLTAFQMMELLGHRDIRTTMRHYNKRSVAPELGAAMERLPAVGKVRKAE